MTIGEGHIFEKVIIWLLKAGSKRSTPGSELVSFTRAKQITDIAIGNPTMELSKTMFSTIGTSQKYKERDEFHKQLRGMAQASSTRTRDEITSVDPCTTNKTFEGGYEYLLQWFHENKIG